MSKDLKRVVRFLIYKSIAENIKINEASFIKEEKLKINKPPLLGGGLSLREKD